MKGLGLAASVSIMLGVSPIWIWSVWYARVGGGLAHVWFWSMVEALAFALVILFVHKSYPSRIKCMWCGAKLNVEDSDAA